MFPLYIAEVHRAAFAATDAKFVAEALAFRGRIARIQVDSGFFEDQQLAAAVSLDRPAAVHRIERPNRSHMFHAEPSRCGQDWPVGG